MTQELLQERIHTASQGRYTFEIKQYNSDSWRESRVECYCQKHQYTWTTGASQLIYRGAGCPKCATEATAKKKRIPVDKIQQQLDMLSQGRYTLLTRPSSDVAIASQDMTARCNTCGYEWSTKLSSLLKGTGCRKCARQKRKNIDAHKPEVLDKIRQVLESQHIDFKVIDYPNAKKARIECHCNVCNHTWQRGYILDLIKNSTGCPNCKNKAKGQRKRTSNDTIHKRLVEVSQGRYTFRVVEFKTQVNSRVECQCMKCGNVWATSYDILHRRSSGCPKCAFLIGAKKVSEQTRTPYEVALVRLKEALEPKGIRFKLDEVAYQGYTTQVECYCPKHDHKWSAPVSSLLGGRTRRGMGCYWCGKESTAELLKHSLDEVQQRLTDEANGEFTFELTEYKNMNQRIRCQCTARGHVWYPKIVYLLTCHSKCPSCATIVSAPEKEITDFIRTLTAHEVIENTRQLIPPLEIDIYIPQLNLAFEFNGTYWHSDEVITKKRHGFLSAQQYHDYKTQQCAQKGVKLVHIAEAEYVADRQKVLDIIAQEVRDAH